MFLRTADRSHQNLYYSGDGYVLTYKRLTNGSFQWPRTETELRLLDARSFRWLMEGLKTRPAKGNSKGEKERPVLAVKPLMTLYFFCRFVVS